LLACLWALGAGLAIAAAQSPRSLTLAEAEDVAVRNHPLATASQLRAEAAKQVTVEVRSAYFPSLFGNMTGAEAGTQNRIAAGGLNNPIILSRYASGVNVSQLITDFGRTADLSKSSQLQAQAESQNVIATRAQILIQLDQAYFSVLRAQ